MSETPFNTEMSQETIDEYKRAGEYMLNNFNYNAIDEKQETKRLEREQLLMFADQGLKSGLSPKELTEQELGILNEVYGDEWYKRYGLSSENIPVPMFQLATKEKKTNSEKKAVNKYHKKMISLIKQQQILNGNNKK
jgi:hypothetical protein